LILLFSACDRFKHVFEQIINPPTAFFNIADSIGFAPLEVTFIDQSTEGSNSITNWFWDFGDGCDTTYTSYIDTIRHTYSDSGHFSVSLKVSSGNEDDTFNKQDCIITSLKLPEAEFSANPQTGNQPLEVIFSDESLLGTYPITYWEWNFGDNIDSTYTSYLETIKHTYADTGHYTVSLKVSMGEESNTEIKTNYITVLEYGEDIPPTAGFIANPTTGYAPLTVTFTDNSLQGTYPITNWEWDFDNNGILDAFGEGPHEFTYPDSGSYSVKLSVSDSNLNDDIVEIDLIDVDALPPEAQFSFSPQTGYFPLDVSFTDESIQGTYPIISWEWDFENDGTIDSYEQNPTFIYDNVGNYSITLNVSDGSLNTSITKSIEVLGQNVLIELFTGNWCVNCPVAEAALHHLKSIYGNRLSYVEYHLYDELQIPESIELQNYYSASSLPSTIIQGTDLIMGTPEGLENLIISYIDPILEQATEVELLELEIEMTRDQLDCSVQINIEPGTDITDYYLKYVLIEDESTEYFNHAHENLRNIAIAADKLSLETQALEQPVEFSLELMNLPYPLPDDIILVVWVQKIVEPYNESTCQVYNVIEKSVE